MNSKYLKSLRNAYFALVAGIVFLMIVSLLIKSINGPLSEMWHCVILEPTGLNV